MTNWTRLSKSSAVIAPIPNCLFWVDEFSTHCNRVVKKVGPRLRDTAPKHPQIVGGEFTQPRVQLFHSPGPRSRSCPTWCGTGSGGRRAQSRSRAASRPPATGRSWPARGRRTCKKETSNDGFVPMLRDKPRFFRAKNDSLEFILALQQVSVVVGIFHENRVTLLVALFLYLKSDLEHNRHLKWFQCLGNSYWTICRLII